MVLRILITVILLFAVSGGGTVMAGDGKSSLKLEAAADAAYMRRDYVEAHSYYLIALSGVSGDDFDRYFKLVCKTAMASIEAITDDSILDIKTQTASVLYVIERAIYYAERGYGRKSPQYADAKFLQGVCLFIAGETDGSMEALEACLDGDLDLDRTVNIMVAMGVILTALGEHEGAIELLDFAVECATEVKPLPAEPEIVTDLYFSSRIALASALFEAGSSEEALDIVAGVAEQAKAFAEQGPQAAVLTVRLLTVAVNASFMNGEMVPACNYAESAFEIASRLLGEADPITLGAMDKLADMLLARGMTARAVDYYKRSLEARKKIYLFNMVPIAQAHANLAACYMLVPNTALAEKHLGQAIDLLERYGKKGSPLYAEYKERLDALCERVEITWMPILWLEAFVAGDEETTDALYEEMRAELQGLIDKERYIYYDVSSLYTAAVICRAIEDYDAAHYLIKEAIAVLEDDLSPSYLYLSLLDEHALLHEEMGELDVAEGIYTDLFNALFKNMYRNFIFMPVEDRESYWRDYLPLVKKMQAFALRNASFNPALAAFAYDCEIASRNVLLESTRRLMSVIMEGGDAEMKDKWGKYVWVLREIQKEKIRMSDPDAVPSVVHDDRSRIGLKKPEARIDVLEEYKRTLEKWFGNKAHLNHDLGIWSVMWTDIREALAPGMACVEYIACKENDIDESPYYWALVVTPDCENPRAVELGSREEIIAAMYSGSDRDASGDICTDSVYSRLWMPVVPYVEGYNNVYISLADELNAIPLDASVNYRELAGGKSQTNFINVMSGGDITRPVEDVKRPGSALLVGGMDFWESDSDASPAYRGQGYDFLPGSLHEVQGAAELLGAAGWKTTLLKDLAATKKGFLSLVSDSTAGIIHLSTHGFSFPRLSEDGGPARSYLERNYANADDPLMRTGLLFSGVNEYIVVRENDASAVSGAVPADDGILSAAEISSLWLAGTQLVVLSACETGRGDIDGSEGVYGLQRALRLAGVRNMIVTLYRIPDRETVGFMTSFYKYLVAGYTLHDSFGRARMSLMEKYPEDPRIWAAFKLIE